MKQCENCSTKGLFLKLKNGLCENCYNELKTLESTYDDILDKMSSENINIRELNSSLNKLIVKIRKFNSISNTIKEEDCLRLLEMLMKNPHLSQGLKDNNLSFAFNDLDIVNDKKTITDFELSNVVNSSNICINKENNIPNNNIEDNTISFTSKIPTLELANSQLHYNDFIDSAENIKVKAIEAVQKETDIHEIQQNNKFENALDKTIIINEVTDIISSIKQQQDNIQDLAYNVFLLKDKYVEKLSSNGIIEIDGVNVSDLINNTLNILSIKLNFPVEKLPDFFNYIAIGIQTSGQHLPNSEILEICAQKISYGKVIDTFYSYVKPLKTLNVQTQRLTGISNSSVESAPLVEEALINLQEFANGYMFVGYNINFIASFINYYYSLYYNKDLITKSDCLLKLYRTRYKGYHSEPPKKFDLTSICNDMLEKNDMLELNTATSKASSVAMASYKLFEILKYRYK